MIPFFVLYLFYGTTFLDEADNKTPKWCFGMQAFCYFMYRMLDEMDGK